jgi:hypothetical protein
VLERRDLDIGLFVGFRAPDGEARSLIGALDDLVARDEVGNGVASGTS